MNIRTLGLFCAVLILLTGIYIVRKNISHEPTTPLSQPIDPVVTPQNIVPTHMITTSNESEPMPTDANLLDSPIAKKWEQEEGYTRNDLLEAQAIMRKEGIPEDRMNDPGIVRRYLLPRVVTLVQISEIILPENTSPDTEIDFQLKGAVPTPEFNFVRFDIVRQDDVIRIRALGHSPASPPDGSESAMLPIELSGKLDPLPPGIYRIIIPDLGMSGTKILEVR